MDSPGRGARPRHTGGRGVSWACDAIEGAADGSTRDTARPARPSLRCGSVIRAGTPTRLGNSQGQQPRPAQKGRAVATRPFRRRMRVCLGQNWLRSRGVWANSPGRETNAEGAVQLHNDRIVTLELVQFAADGLRLRVFE